jgi:hypothetical protein
VWLTISYNITLVIESVYATLTPTILKRHFALRAKLAEIGITEKYSHSAVQQWKRAIVRNNSTFKSRVIAKIALYSNKLRENLDVYNKSYSTLTKARYYISILLIEKLFGSTESLTFYKYAHWKSIPVTEFPQEELPEKVSKVVKSTGTFGFNAVVEKAFLGEEPLDPFLTYSVLPHKLNKVLCFFGITYFNLTVLQWGDPHFIGSKYNRKQPIR